jgi:hypothetical protein
MALQELNGMHPSGQPREDAAWSPTGPAAERCQEHPRQHVVRTQQRHLLNWLIISEAFESTWPITTTRKIDVMSATNGARHIVQSVQSGRSPLLASHLRYKAIMNHPQFKMVVWRDLRWASAKLDAILVVIEIE